jgi:glycine/D-amino acid oxidase-like deaminating enzyme
MWGEEVSLPEVPPLLGSINADVAIIGAGITGVTAAYLLSKAGYQVALIEQDRVGEGATGYTTAFLLAHIDTAIRDLIPMFGRDKARAILASHAEAIDFFEQTAQRENIAYDFRRCSNYLYANSREEYEELAHEQRAAAEIGVTMHLKRDDALGFPNFGYLELQNQAKFHPLKYLAGIVKVLQARGVQIFEHTEALEIKRGKPATVVTSGGEVTANTVFVATYAPFDGKLHFKKAFYKTYVLAGRLPRGSVAEGIYEDVATPYHYLRVDRGDTHDRMIFGGGDHRADIPVDAEKSYRALTADLRRIFADISFEITHRWDGKIVESIDGLAFIGPASEENIFYATGFSGNGMTYSVIAAQMVADLVQGKQSPALTLYNARRWPTLRQLAHKGRDYSKVLLGGAVRTTFGSANKNKKGTQADP